MKKILLFSSLIIAGGANAQITLTQANNAPANSDTYTMTTSGTTTVSPGATGTGVTWNMSTINIGTTPIAHSALNSANATYTPANIVDNYGSESSYYQSTTNFLKYFGGNIVLSGLPTTITYTAGANYALYPMSFGTTTTAAIGGTLSASSNNGSFTGNCKSTADGTGTLMLPGKTYTNVLRVLVTQTINFAVPSFFITSGILNQDTYNYFIPGRKSPIVTVVTSTVVAPPIAATPSSQTITTVASDYLVVTGLNEKTQTFTDLSVYPNPAANVINITTQNKTAITVDVIDITGKKLNTLTFVNGIASPNTTNLANGIYIYAIKDNNNQTLATGKFSVAH